MSFDARFRHALAAALLAGTSVRAAAQPATPPAPLPPLAVLRDSTFFPEGMDVHPRTGAVYVASIRHGTIVERTADGHERELLPRHQSAFPSIMGVRVDVDGTSLWATVSMLPYALRRGPATDTTLAALVRVRIADGAVLGRWPVPVTAAAPLPPILGDLAVAPDGTVWVSDSRNPQLLRLRPGATSLERLTDSLFRNLQGLAIAPDGRTLYAADYSRGLLRVDAAHGTVTRVTRVTAPAGIESRGIDGIAMHEGAIVAVQNGVAPARVMRFTLDAEGRTITDAAVLERAAPGAGEPTIGAVASAAGQSWFVYVANSQWDKYDEAGARLPGTALARPVLRRVALPPAPLPSPSR